jgi:hypothetical protein
VPDQARLRAPERIHDLDEFLQFLRRFRALFGADDRPRRTTTGNRFLL